jgi:hypothetical protein
LHNKDYRIARKPFSNYLIRGEHVIKDKSSEMYGRHFITKGDITCKHCGANMWLSERISNSSKKKPEFNLCCSNGKVVLMQYEIPEEYRKFLCSSIKSIELFRNRIRLYNSALAFTSSKMNLDESLINNSKGNNFT